MKRVALVVALAAGCSHSTAVVPLDADGTTEPDAAPPAAGDGFPVGAIAMFLSTGCPSGWSSYADAVGRTIVPSSASTAGVTVGAPLIANEQRAHDHDLAIGVDLPSVSYVGAAGGGNNGVAGSGAVDRTTATDSGVAGLPYAQLLVCRKSEPPGDVTPPAGAIAFFADAACPTGWSELDPALRGRVLVGLPTGGTPGATFGGAPLASGESRTHTHAATATVTGGSHGIALASGCCAGGYAAAGDHVTTATATPAAVDLPYIQLLACLAP